jgi:phosphoglycerate dehydrogenase-like enzyme
MLNLTPNRIVIGANAHADIAAALRTVRPSLEVRGNRFTEITLGDLEWGEVYVGFKRPPVATMGNVRWVHCTGAGVDAWFSPTEVSRDILLTRSAESFGAQIAEWALARALAMTQQVLDVAKCQASHEWAQRDISMLRGTRALIVGTGDIGTSIGRVFRAMGVEVSGVSRTGRGDASVFASVAQPAALPSLVQQTDWLIVTVPLTPATRHLINRDVLSQCRSVVLMNAGRGAVVDEALLPEALDKGWLRAIALDVFEVEPLPVDSPLWNDARVMISPHISGLTTVAGVVDGFFECLHDIEAGVTPKWTVDREQQY